MDNLTQYNPASLPFAAFVPAGILSMDEWLRQRQRLVGELTQELRAGFQAVAAFDGGTYLDCVDRQEALCRRMAALDARKPEPGHDAAANRRAQATLRHMNGELKQLGNLQAALIETGGRSVRCFQRVWALGAAAYGPPGVSKY